MLPQQRAELVVANLAEATLRIATADDPAQLAVLATPVKRALQQLEEHIAGFPPKLRARAQEQFTTFEDGLLGARGLIAVRGLELQALERAQRALDENAAISARLTAAVDGLVGEARGEMTAATADAASVQQVSSRVLIAVVLLSLLSSGLIVWRYVQRDLLKRLSALSGSMLAVAGGNLRVPLPPAGGEDEIAEMTRALTVFRDTAVEIEDQGLREIAQARQRLVDAIESISEGFALFDRDDRLVLCNSRYRDLLYPGLADVMAPGTPFETIIRRAAERGLVEEARGRVEEWVAERLASHRSASGVEVPHRSGERWIRISERRTTDGGSVAVYTDVTDLQVARDQAMHATEAKSQFLASMSHELRTPMNAIIGFTRLVMRRSKDVLPAQQYGNLEKILASANHLLALLNDVLDLSKIEAGKMAVLVERFDVAALIGQVQAVVQPLIAKNANTLVVDCAPDLGAMRTDQTKLRQNLFNLLSNAAKFTSRGGSRWPRGGWSGTAPTGWSSRCPTPASACPRSSSPAVRGVHAGGSVDRARLRRHRARPRDYQALLPDAGRRSHGPERPRRRLDLHDRAAGGRPRRRSRASGERAACGRRLVIAPEDAAHRAEGRRGFAPWRHARTGTCAWCAAARRERCCRSCRACPSRSTGGISGSGTWTPASPSTRCSATGRPAPCGCAPRTD